MPRYSFHAAFVAAAALTLSASASTIATFADPAADGSTPLFHFVNGIPGSGVLSGGWGTNGLLLQTPGLAAPDFPNAHFLMAGVNATGGPTTWALGPGSISFTDSAFNPLYTISFLSGSLTSPVGFGSSDFAGQGVTFSGPIIPAGLSDEAFAFSFANPVGTLSDYTVTSAFTSSATIPEPASIMLLVLGGAALVRRR